MKMPEALARIEVVHDTPAKDMIYVCGGTISRIREDISDKLDIILAVIQVT